jgi:mannosyltransferase OCH1-like enzyme
MSYTIIAIVIIVILAIIFFKLYEINKNIIITSNLVTKNDSLVENTIPKIIIQTWKSNSVPQRYMQLMNSLKKCNPDYEHLFFTDNDIEKFLREYYPEYYVTYLKLPIKIQRIDFFRYIAVYHFGGFYMDLDMQCLNSFDDLLKYKCVFPIDEFISKDMCGLNRYSEFCDNGYYFLLGQYAFAAAPKHPFIKELIDGIHKNINNYIKYANSESEDYVYKTTGPDFVTLAYINSYKKKDIFIVNNGKRQYFGDYAKHNYFGTWK